MPVMVISVVLVLSSAALAPTPPFGVVTVMPVWRVNTGNSSSIYSNPGDRVNPPCGSIRTLVISWAPLK